MYGTRQCVGGSAMSAQDKYTVKVPGGLAFSAFRDTRPGRLFLLVRTETCLLRSSPNPVISRPTGPEFPATASRSRRLKMAKIHWSPKSWRRSPQRRCRHAARRRLHGEGGKRFADSGGLGMGRRFKYEAASRRFTPGDHGRLATAGERRQVWIGVPHDREGERLRLHGLRESLNGKQHGPCVFCGDDSRPGNLGPGQGDFTAAWPGVPRSVPAREVLAYLCRRDLAGIRHRPTLAAHSRRRLPLAAQLFLGLAAAV